MNENMKYSLHYKKYEINSLRQFIKFHAVYLGQPSFRYSLSLNCGIYIGCILNMKLNSIFHESNACLPRGVLGDKINSTCNSLNDCKKTPPIIGKKNMTFYVL